MSRDFFERHFVAGGDPKSFEEHRIQCAECRALSGDFIRLDALRSRIGLPPLSPAARENWKRIPSLTVDCDRASELSARTIEGPIDGPDRDRLAFHLARCEACRETAAVLSLPAGLRAPAPESGWSIRPPAPVVSLAKARSKRASARSSWSDPRLYAAAACFLAGFAAFFANNFQATQSPGAPLSVAGEIQNNLRVRWAEAADRVQIWEEGISRHWVATRETFTGYTRAAGAIALSAAGRATEGFLRNETKTEKGKKS